MATSNIFLNENECSKQNLGDVNNVEPENIVNNEVSILEAKIFDLQQRLDAFEADKDLFFNMWITDKNDYDFSKMVIAEGNYLAWFRFLPQLVSRFLVVMVVRDTPGSHMPKDVYRYILSAGFSNFRTDLWNTYIGVFFKGKCWYNERKVNEEKCTYHYESLDGNFIISANSESWKNGDKGQVFINGKQLARNTRGVNVVVYDVTSSKLIDSISFDSHDDGHFLFSR